MVLDIGCTQENWSYYRNFACRRYETNTKPGYQDGFATCQRALEGIVYEYGKDDSI